MVSIDSPLIWAWIVVAVVVEMRTMLSISPNIMMVEDSLIFIFVFFLTFSFALKRA